MPYDGPASKRTLTSLPGPLARLNAPMLIQFVKFGLVGVSNTVLAFAIGAGFWWAVRTGQFDDLEGPAHRIVADDDLPQVDATQPSADRDETSHAARLTSVNAARNHDQ